MCYDNLRCYDNYLIDIIFYRFAGPLALSSASAVPSLRKRKERPGHLIVVGGLRRPAGPHVVDIRLSAPHGLFNARSDRGAHCTQQSFKLNFTHLRLTGLARRVPEMTWAPVAEIAKIVSIGAKLLRHGLSLAHDPTDGHARRHGSPIRMQSRLSSAYRGRFPAGWPCEAAASARWRPCAPVGLTLSQSAMITVSVRSGFG